MDSQFVAAAREAVGATLQETAVASGFALATISKWEQGLTPNEASAKKLVRVFRQMAKARVLKVQQMVKRLDALEG